MVGLDKSVKLLGDNFALIVYVYHIAILARAKLENGASRTSCEEKVGIFPIYLKHIKKCNCCSKDHLILLIFDSHKSHTFLASVDYAKEWYNSPHDPAFNH